MPRGFERVRIPNFKRWYGHIIVPVHIVLPARSLHGIQTATALLSDAAHVPHRFLPQQLGSGSHSTSQHYHYSPFPSLTESPTQ